MASEYLRWKFRDLKPDAPPAPLTRRQRWRNWWHYHKGQTIAAAAGLVILADIARSALGLGQVRPDYQIAYVGRDPLPEETAAAVEEAFAVLGGDANQDGQTVVQLHQYLTDAAEDAEYAYANQVALMGDLEDCDSCFFLLEDYETFQVQYAVLADAEGSIPGAAESPFALNWSACPALAGQELGGYTQEILGQEIRGDNQELLGPLYLARRGFEAGRSCENPDACDALWNALTKGADPS